MRNRKIHPNRVALNVARVLVIVIVCLAGIQPMTAQSTPIAQTKAVRAQTAISNAGTFSGSASSSQPGIPPLPRMAIQDMITDLGTLDPVAINDKGQIVGNYNGHAYLWENGEVTDLGTLGGDYSWVQDINENGQIAGQSDVSSDDYRHAFLWQDGKMKDLNTIAGSYSSAYGINNLGQVVGDFYLIVSPGRYMGPYAFLWQNDAMTALKTLDGQTCEAEAINDKGQIVGSSVVQPMGWTHAFLWQNDTMTNLGALPRGGDSYALDINEDGLVVGYSEIVFENPSYGYFHAFLYKNHSMIDLGTLGVRETSSTAVAINDKGQIVGHSGIAQWDSEQHAFLWQNNKMIDLNHLFVGTGWTMYDAYDINNAGQVVGKITLNADKYRTNRNILLQLPPDLTVESVAPVQVLDNHELVKYKATAVKAVIRKNGKGTVESVPVTLTYGDATYTRFYVADKKNLDETTHALKDDNTAYPLNFTDAEKDETKTIYFFSDGLAPQGDTFQAAVTVDPKDEILELDEDNNTKSSEKVNVYDTQWPSNSPFPNLEIYYIRTDGLSRPDLNAFYGVSNDFIKGVYPIAERRFLPGRAAMTLDTTNARGDDGKLDWLELTEWVKANLSLLRLAYTENLPYPDETRFVATVPSGWFKATTIDTAGSAPMNLSGFVFTTMPELVVVEATLPTRPNGSNIAAHEIGHSFGLAVPCEEYSKNCDSTLDRVGNYANTGLWVDKRILMENTKDRAIYCFMGATYDLDYWVDSADYSQLFNDHRTVGALRANEPTLAAGAILVVANFSMNGTVMLDDWYSLPEAGLSELRPGPYVFEYQDAGGNILDQRSFDVSYSVEGRTLPQVGFVATIPAIPGTAKIVVKYYDTPRAEKVFSANAPAVTVLSPNGGERLSGPAAIRWSGNDADGDALTYALLISSDNGATWDPIAGDLTATSYTWDFSQLPAGAQYRIKVIATDGINTGYDLSNAPFTIKAQTYLPLILHKR